jgi:peptide/nickel transport system substrate-binding protein
MNILVRRLSKIVLAVFMIVPLAGSAIGCTPSPGGTPPGEASERLLRVTAANLPKIDPAVGSDGASAIAQVNLYDSLVFPKPDGTMSPSVAKDWEVSEDGIEWTFHLRDDVKFHNGDLLTAEDVVYSLERLVTVGQGWAYLFKGRVKEAIALDEYTVKFVLEEPFGPFLSVLYRLYLLNKDQVIANTQKDGMYGENGDYGTQWLLTNDAGSGPYRVKEMKQGEYFLAEKYDEYWQPLKDTNPTSFKIIGTTEAVTVRTLMSRKELEIADEWQSSEALEALGKLPGVNLQALPGAGHTEMFLNNKKAPTDDVAVRKAIAYCLDYDTITETIIPGAPKPHGMVSTRLAGHNPNVEQLTQDLEKAQEWLKQSKYYENLGDYEIELAWVAEVPSTEKIALLVQANAEALGIKVNLVRVPWVTLVDRAFKPETTPNATICSQSPDYAEAGGYLYSRWHSSGAGTWIQMDWLSNPDIDAAIDDALRTIDWDTRMQKYQAIQSTLMDIQPSVPLYQSFSRRAYQDYVVWEHAENAKAGKPMYVVSGYALYLPDIEVFPERAQD